MGSKRDARRRRRKQREKQVREAARPNPEKAPKEAFNVAPAKVIPSTALKPSTKKMAPDISIADREGVWSWGVARDWGEQVWLEQLAPFLTDYSQKTWGQIDTEATGSARHRRPKHIHYDFDQLKREAIKRLEDLKLDDFAPNIFRFRMSGRKRLYGFRINPKFHVLWYDPTHAIYKPARR